MILKYSNKIKNIAFLSTCVLSIITLSACSVDSVVDMNNNLQYPTDASPVVTLTTEYEDYVMSLDYVGFVSAQDIRRLSFEQSGKIERMYVKDGQKISRGELIAELDTSNIQRAINNANQDILLAQNSITQIHNSIENLQLAIEAEKLNLENVIIAYEAEKLNLENVIIAYEAEKLNLENVIIAYEAEISNLTKIEDSYNSAIEIIMLTYDNIETTYERASVLYAESIISTQEYDQAKYAYDSVVRELESIEQNRDNDVLLQKRNIEGMANNIDLQNKNIASMENNISLQKKNLESMENNIELQRIKIRTMENDLQSAHLQLDAAQLKLNQANIQLEQYNKNLNDAKLISYMDGYVMGILMQAGEVTSAGNPVIAITSEDQVVNIGVSVDDISKISSGMHVIMESSGQTFSGVISSVSQYPDESSRTYNVEIVSENMDLPTGSIVNVEIPIETQQGISIPIRSIINQNGVDYIYTLQQNETENTFTVLKTEVILGTIKDENVFVENISDNVIFVSEGVRNIEENSIVTILE